MDQTFEEIERVISRDIAFVRGMEINVLTPRTGGLATELRQRALTILRLDADGAWRFARGMTNFDAR